MSPKDLLQMRALIEAVLKRYPDPPLSIIELVDAPGLDLMLAEGQGMNQNIILALIGIANMFGAEFSMSHLKEGIEIQIY